MGLFKSSKKESGPLPNLALHVAAPKEKVFKPNDNVSGHISLNTPVPINPQAIEVSFWGRSTVWIRVENSHDNKSSDYDHYRDNAPLFDVTFNLLQHSQQLQPGQDYTFPFNFRVPEGTDTNRTGCYKHDSNDPWTVLPHHLPPTFYWGGNQDLPDCGRITYGVTARLICFGIGTGRHGEKPLSCTADILFQPLNPHINALLSVIRFPKNLILASSALTGQDPKSIGFRQKLSDKFSSGTPKLDFEVGVELPDLLSSGSEFSFRSTFAVLNKSGNVVHIPAITFRPLKVELLDFTFLRANRDYEANYFMSGDHRDGTDVNTPTGPYSGQNRTINREKKTALNSVPESKTMMLEEVMAAGEKKGMEQAKNCEVCFSARVPGFVPPSFKSFAITRAYRIKVKMGIEIGGKKFVHEAESYVASLGSAA